MGSQQVKSKLFSAVECGDVKTTIKIFESYPELLDASLSGSNTVNPLQRSAWRGNLDMVMILIEMGCRVDVVDNQGLTALMWAAKRDFPEICIILIRSGADVRRRSMEGLSALDYAVLHGSYASAYMIHEFDKLLQESNSYALIGKVKLYSWVNYEQFVFSLRNGVIVQNAINFFERPPGRNLIQHILSEEKQFIDPVVDPRESWSSMIKRIINFDPPPIVERQELPENLQPQNRMWGRINSMVNGQNIQPTSQECNSDDKHSDNIQIIQQQ